MEVRSFPCSWFMYSKTLFRSQDIKPSKADMTHSNMGLVCLSRSSDIRVNLDSVRVCVAGVAAMFPPQRKDSAT